MAIKIQAEEKKYPRDPDYSPESTNDSLNLCGFDKWAIKKRIEQDNRHWIIKQVIEGLIGGVILYFVISKLLG